nr:major histocompatibility complex class I-related gene protein-like [Danio rerio]|eukprot:XP_021326455.1 major histocompatibility complex class I-related gene protein-like [Danio rerio]
MISNSFDGSTTDELRDVDKKFTYYHNLNISAHELKIGLEFTKVLHETLFKPLCFQSSPGYLVKRRNQVIRKVKPKVRLFQKGFRVSCLATGFYPRHINLTLLRDGQPVSDNEVTGGDLLPNGDGTYQMRKSLEIRAEEREKHKYTCSAKHLSLDNKLDVILDNVEKKTYNKFDPGEPYKSVIPSVLIVLALVLVLVTGVVIYKHKKRPAGGNLEDKK